jgi:F420-dependent methylenetetrahydromethanopterin dehydrogenase
MDEALTELLMRRVAATEAEEVSLPHILITLDVVTNVVTYSGPYASAVDALRAADVERSRQEQRHPDWRVTIDVAPLFAPDAAE